ncbi:MAG: hypothetical protein WC340_08535 [Kiritimatiellia bacterium]
MKAFKKLIFIIVGFACSMSYFAMPLQAQTRIGVIGESAQKYLSNKKIDFDQLNQEDLLNLSKTKKYSALIYDAGRPNGEHLTSIRKYVRDGGILYWSYPWQRDIAGAINATGGYIAGSCFKVKAEKSHPLTTGLEAEKWVPIEHPLNFYLPTQAATHVLSVQEKECEVLLSVEIAKVKKDESETPVYVPTSESQTHPWLTVYPYGEGIVITGLHKMFGYETNVQGHNKSVEIIDKLLMNLISFLNDKASARAANPNIPSPKLKYDDELTDLDKKGLTDWPGLKEAAIGRNTQSTACWVTTGDFLDFSKETLAKKLTSFNAKEIAMFADNQTLGKLGSKEGLEKITWLRQQGFVVRISFGRIRSSTGLLPGTKGYNAFFEIVKFWAPKVDIIGCDEWFLSPASMATQGGTVSQFTPELLKAFYQYAGISKEDALWIFEGKNKYSNSNDPRVLKAWEFCAKIQNEIMSEFVRVAKKSNPDVRTWVSYITNNWNKLVTSIDSSVSNFDEILDCQTYWYGRYSDDPLNAAKISNAIGLGKIYQTEYPNKTVWMGFGPGYAGGKPTTKENTKWWRHASHYNNTPEEVVPYLATLYASSDGVFVFTAFNGNAPGDGSDDDFADVFRLVSNLIPRVKDYVKSDIAYYYDPVATWDIAKGGSAAYTQREGNRVSIGYLQQFCDVNVTKDVSKYQNVIVSGSLLPRILDYKNQNLYFMYRPEYSEDGEKLIPAQMAKLGIKTFSYGPTSYYQLSGDLQIDKVLGYSYGTITDADNVLRTLTDGKEEYVVGAQNQKGNIRINSFLPPYTHQNVMRKILKEDLGHFKWIKRDCLQINGKKDIVAVAFREARTAVIDFGRDVSHKKVKLVMFNGKDGVTQNEVVTYSRDMKVKLLPLNVLVATGVK